MDDVQCSPNKHNLFSFYVQPKSYSSIMTDCFTARKVSLHLSTQRKAVYPSLPDTCLFIIGIVTSTIELQHLGITVAYSNCISDHTDYIFVVTPDRQIIRHIRSDPRL